MKTILLFLIFSFSFMQANDLYLHRNQIYVAPEVYSLTRTKKGGGKQHGTPAGLRIGYDRLKRFGWYWGLEGSGSWGKLKGHSITGIKNRSDFSDLWAEARGGYTFQQKDGRQASFTPFIGIGYEQETNNFLSPTPLKIHFKTKYPFASAGFLFWMKACGPFEVGFNFRARYPIDPKCRVTNDSANDNFEQLTKERVQYRVDLPITYSFSCQGKWAIALTPFWESRVYGTRMNYPFDFIKTKFQFWGGSLQLIMRF